MPLFDEELQRKGHYLVGIFDQRYTYSRLDDARFFCLSFLAFNDSLDDSVISVRVFGSKENEYIDYKVEQISMQRQSNICVSEEMNIVGWHKKGI